MKRQVILSLVVLLVIASACAVPFTPKLITATNPPTSTPTLTLAPSQTIAPTQTPTLTPTPTVSPSQTIAPTKTSMPPPTAPPSSPPTPSNSGVAGAIEFESLTIKMADTVATSVQDMSPFGVQQWSNGKQLFGAGNVGSAITFDVTMTTTARYALDLYLTRAPDFAILQLTLDGEKYGAPVDLYARQVSPSGRVPAGGFDLSAGTHELGFRVVGKNSSSSNYKFGLDSFTLTPGQSVGLAITPMPTPTVTPPPPNPAYPLLTVQIQAVQMADDDGKRLTQITNDQVKQWIDKANEIWAVAGIRYLYDPDSDFPIVKNTLVNSMEAEGDANATQDRRQGDEIAARYPGKLVILFRWGSRANPTGQAFSSTNQNFVAGVGFNNTACGHQNIQQIAHEVGHYLGLPHTFPQVFQSVQEAETYMRAHGNKPDAFDYDGFSDTPPDPFISTPEIQCSTLASVNLNGFEFPLPRTNIMSYYNNGLTDESALSPQQIERARWVLGVRAQNGMAIPPNFHIP